MDISYDSLVKRTISFNLLILLAASFKSTHFNFQVGMESQTDWEKTAFTKSLQKWFLSHVHLHENVEVERQLVLFVFLQNPNSFSTEFLPLTAQVTESQVKPESSSHCWRTLPGKLAHRHPSYPPYPHSTPPHQLSHLPLQSLSLLPPLLGQAHKKRILCRPKARYGHCIFRSIW